MYGWLWRRLPDPPLLRLTLAVLVVVAVVVVLFGVVFPWAEPRLPFTDVTVEPGPASPSGAVPSPTGG